MKTEDSIIKKKVIQALGWVRMTITGTWSYCLGTEWLYFDNAHK